LNNAKTLQANVADGIHSLLVLCLARTTSSHDRLSASKTQVLLLRCQVAKLIRTAKSQLRTLQASLLVR
jgi:tRNA(Met) C34 N-acetyltransferase TmcA